MSTARKPSLKLGVTGGIGSGKTTVCRVFSVLGVPVFSADNEARKFMNNDTSLIRQINMLTGKDLYASGKLDRQELARLIFNDPDLLGRVNALVHPVVFDHFRKWVEKQDTPYVVMEAAILFESGASSMIDKVLTIVTPVEERIDRLVNGKKFTREQVMERIKNQIDDDFRISHSDYVIHNSENDMILPAILDIHHDMIKHYNRK